MMLLSDQSMHTANIIHNPCVSMFCQLPRQVNNQASAALSRVTVMGHVTAVPDEELSALQLAFTIIHPYAEQIIDSPKFKLFRLQPEKIYFSGGFGVMATWVNVEDYRNARADVLAAEVPSVLSRVNLDKQGELLLVCKHFLGLNDVESVRVQAVDRLGIDLRVKTGEALHCLLTMPTAMPKDMYDLYNQLFIDGFLSVSKLVNHVHTMHISYLRCTVAGELTDEYRVGFRHEVNSSEDAKSEMVKLFQEAWEREQGFFFTDELPPITKYAEDILRSARKSEGAGGTKVGGAQL